jgi:hypothetical protein
MRMQITLRKDLVQVLADLARKENRYPKQQAEWLLQQALEAATAPPVAPEGIGEERA